MITTLKNPPTSPVLEKNNKDLDYSAYLQENFNLKPELRGFWAVVGKSDRTQGWKLHISTIGGEVIRLLDKVIPCLLAHKVSCFKVARDTLILGYLNEGELGGTQIGKFMTIYPENDSAAVKLAHDLVALTKSMHGPIIVSDLRLGDVVYTRYGGFNPIVQRDRLGLMRLMIYAPDGTLQEDKYQVPFKGHEGISNPFEGWFFERTEDVQPSPVHIVDGKQTNLFGPGYLILDVLREQPKGSVFQVLDLRRQETVGLKVLKQGKRFCMTDLFDRDMRHRLQHQANLHQQLAQQVPISQADAYFEVDGNGYLPLEWIEGQSIETLAVQTLESSSFNSLTIDKKNLLLNNCQKLIEAVAQLHALGYVHRDLTASNIWLGENGKLYLLDLELCHAINDSTPAFGLGTGGFMSPQQERREPPSFSDDLYAIGCLLVLIFTGTDPRRIVMRQGNDPDLLQRLLDLTKIETSALAETIIHCLDHDPAMRPSLDTISSALSAEIANQTKQPNVEKNKVSNVVYLSDIELRNNLNRGINGLLQSDGAVQTETGLWLSTALEGVQHQVKHRYSQQYEFRRSANRGMAGVVYTLSRLGRFACLTPESILHAQAAIDWLVSNPMTQDTSLPGLHFGSAGVAVALVEAITAGILASSDNIFNFIKNCFTKYIDWPDITHGAAGQGIAALYCFDYLGWPFFKEHAQCCVDYLLATQQADGSWIMPEGVPGMSGETLSGFGHGVAGMAYFLAEFSIREKNNTIWESVARALDWLQKQQITQIYRKNTVLAWHYSDRNPSIWKWWCHGGVGIALTFLRTYKLTGDPSYAEVAKKALRAHRRKLHYPNLSQCHGVSGLGDIYLEAFRVLHEEEWLERAQYLANFLTIMARSTKTGDLYWLVEDPHTPTADLMVGSGGILHFFLRLLCLDQNISAPLLLD